MADCPCCGAALPADDRVFIDLDGGFIASNGLVARLPATEFNLFMELWRVKPRMLKDDQLLDRLYQLRIDSEPDLPIIKVFVHKIRKALAPLGIELETVWGRGYRIKPNRGNDHDHQN